jgi:hypothetical protein
MFETFFIALSIFHDDSYATLPSHVSDYTDLLLDMPIPLLVALYSYHAVIPMHPGSKYQHSNCLVCTVDISLVSPQELTPS